MLSRPLTNALIILQNSPLSDDGYIEQYTHDEDFKAVYESLMNGTKNEELNYHVNDKLLDHLGKICISPNERVHVIRQAHTSIIFGHFGVGKIIA